LSLVSVSVYYFLTLPLRTYTWCVLMSQFLLAFTRSLLPSFMITFSERSLDLQAQFYTSGRPSLSQSSGRQQSYILSFSMFVGPEVLCCNYLNPFLLVAVRSSYIRRDVPDSDCEAKVLVNSYPSSSSLPTRTLAESLV
jgi:hypothetical protein